MKYSLLALLCVVMLGCDRSDHKQTQELPSREMFQRKMDCEKYASKIEDEVREPGHPKNDWSNPSVSLVFYSEPRNSCVAVVTSMQLIRPAGKAEDDIWYYVYIQDALTKEGLWWQSYHGDKALNMDSEVNAQILKLGGPVAGHPTATPSKKGP